MLKSFTAEQLRYIANGGGSIHVDGGDFSADQLRFVANGLQAGATLIVSNAKLFQPDQLRYIANGSSEGATVLFQ